jgi:hypothetical protein
VALTSQERYAHRKAEASAREIEKITRVYLATYTGHGTDFQDLKISNLEILSKTIQAVEALFPILFFYTLQTGSKVFYDTPHNST